MRRTLAFFVLTSLAVIAIGCGKDSQPSGNAPNDNATGTTTYSNSSVPQPTTAARPADSAGGNSNAPGSGGAAPKSSPNKTGIKPPTE